MKLQTNEQKFEHLKDSGEVVADGELGVGVRLESFFKQDYVVLRQVTRKTGELAKLAVWDYGVAPKDAVHLATALQAEFQYLDTFDEGLIKKSGEIGNPSLTIGYPYVSGQGEFALAASPNSDEEE